ncbi:MAG: hypothetical protein D6795_01970, partial [Deltaproteobacteria bacterium]
SGEALAVPEISNLSAIGSGTSIPVGGIFARRLAVGFGIYLPLDKLVTVGSIAVNEPDFYQYHDFGQRLALYAAAAYEILPSLSIGIGAEILASAEGPASLGIDAERFEITSRRLEFDVFPRAAPTAGIQFRPFSSLSLGLSFRSEMVLDFSLPITVVIPGEAGEELVLQAFDNSARTFFTPNQATFGIGYAVGGGWLIAADLVWMDWSKAYDPGVMVQLTLDDTFIIGTEEEELGFHDIVVPRIGIEYTAGEHVALRAGYQFQASPVPDQTTPESNLIDPDKHIFSAGMAFSLAEVFCWKPIPLTIDLAFQYQYLPERVTNKVDPEDPIGAYSAAGSLTTFSISARTRF